MKKLLAILLLLAVLLPARAQWDTTGLSLSKLHVAPLLTSSALIATGSVLTFNSTANKLEVGLRDKLVEADLPHLHFDNYLQYAPLLTPWVLNISGVKGRHSLGRLALIEGGSYLLGSGWINAFKYYFEVLRPDGSTYNSFPSGHTFTAFVGAEILRREYGEEYPWVAAAGYAAAAVVGFMRIYNNRHWLGDVAAGAGIAILSVTLTYWALD